ncbi:pullulanase-type alpha-1,6-glucosidase [Reinekea blandensis]|uniref:Putative pullulanase n=1 Tax=Reinekea blandensis MED297 TaxID=314283 RepID=A4B910_9GAMM|nr:pullulanase-type alpha-1,6-glucosidase [Reinekea blandensis]EAR11111.1 putative pullulanase precursor [Reinekea sp. MED297] [Reinekea blandensis MED297]
MRKTKTLLQVSALALAVGLTACNKDDSNTCTPPETLNSAGVCVNPDGADSLIQPAANQAVIYYKRQDGDYDGWGLHLWGDQMDEEGITWSEPLAHDGVHPLYGAYYLVDLTDENWTEFNFIVHKGDEKDIGGGDLTFLRSEFGTDVFAFQGVANLFPDPIEEIPVTLSGASAHFIDVTGNEGAAILFDARVTSNRISLWHSPSASLQFNEDEKAISGGDEFVLATEPMTSDQAEAYPHLADLDGFWIDATDSEAKALLKGQLWVSETNADGEVLQVTRVQTPNVLDNLYYTAAKDATLGAWTTTGSTEFALWAPTATDVDVLVYDSPVDMTPERFNLTENTDSGIWHVNTSEDLLGHYYLYELTVFHHETDAIETLTVTDPYSLSLSENSLFSQVVDLDDPSLKPVGWTVDKSFADVSHPEDISVYETHIRDLSIWDSAGTDAYDGKFKAFTESARESMTHLSELRTAGMTAIQVLPAFDIATIDEDDTMRVDITDTLANYCALSTAAEAKALALSLNCDTTIIQDALATFDTSTGEAQDFYSHLRGVDSFNWGYDPFHYTVPEGSYATDAEGSARILEFREMVEALHDMDYMVIMDVVYNHTNASGLHEKSVLDKIVPGYYHRRDLASGVVLKDSCCDDTATEHKMMAKLMTDSLVTWARDYQIDGFRFDLMGLQSMTAMQEALAAVEDVNPDVYFYGEGWDYGAAGTNGRGTNASQSNIAGSGIGTFTDRLRDGVRGGSPFDNMDGEEQTLRRNQGLSNSAVPNELNLIGSVDPDSGTADDDGLTPDQELELNVLKNTDLVRAGLAGNLKTFGFENYEGNNVLGTGVDYNGSPAAYADDPQEIVNYVSKHDNQTLWDIIAYKADLTVTSEQRARMQAIAVATSAFAQGVPFYHMGVDLLRSKSMERDSYDSGDWFNKVDFAVGADSNWNVGLPRKDKDESNWDFIKTVIADTDADPTPTDVAWMRAQFKEMLTIRKDSPLFRLTTADEIKGRVAFHNTGENQTPGVIAMSIDDGASAPSNLDDQYDAIVVVFNYTNTSQDVVVEGAANFTQHAAQSETSGVSFNAAAAEGPTFTVPALTAAVFVAAEGDLTAGLPAGDVAPFGETTLYARGSFADWGSVFDGYYAGEGVYKFAVNIGTAGSHSFRFADADWSNSTNADSFTNGAGSAFTLSAEGGDDNNFGFTVAEGEPGDYEFVLDLSGAVPEITILEKDYALANDVYVRGSITDASWNPVAEGLFNYNGAGEYSVSIDATADSYAFKIADVSWTNGTNFGAGTVADVTLGETMLLDGTDDINITIGEDGYYAFILDTMKSLSTPELTVHQYVAFLRGSMNGWGTDDQLVYQGNAVFSITKTLTAGTYQFKIGDADWDRVNLGFGTDTTGSELALTDNSGNFEVVIPADGDYVFTVDAANTLVTVTTAP